MTDTVVQSTKVDQIVEKYIALRDKKSALKKQYDASVLEIDNAMERVENYLLGLMNEAGLKTMNTGLGTVLTVIKSSASCADWPLVLDFIKKNERWDMLVKKVTKEAVESYRDEHQDLPPGINWTELRTVQIRRKS